MKRILFLSLFLTACGSPEPEKYLCYTAGYERSALTEKVPDSLGGFAYAYVDDNGISQSINRSNSHLWTCERRP